METEHTFQRKSVQTLRQMGFVVIVTSSNVRGRRQVRGLPDILVRHRDWERGMWLGIEMKRSDGKGRYSVEQQEEVLRGDVIGVSSWLEVCLALGIPYEEQTEMWGAE